MPISYAENRNAKGLVLDHGPHHSVSDDIDGKEHAKAIRVAEEAIEMYWKRQEKQKARDNYPM